MQFAERLQYLMLDRDVSSYKLAKSLDCTITTVTNWLRGESLPSAKKMQALAGYFGVSTDYLMGSDDTDTPEQAEMAEMLEDIRRNPELRTMFSVTRNATPDEIKQYVRLIKALRGEDE